VEFRTNPDNERIRRTFLEVQLNFLIIGYSVRRGQGMLFSVKTVKHVLQTSFLSSSEKGLHAILCCHPVYFFIYIWIIVDFGASACEYVFLLTRQ
jgi:hypothetical protein